MFTEDQINKLVDALNQVLPPLADAMVSARARMIAKKQDFTDPERDAILLVLDNVHYEGNAQQVQEQMARVIELRHALQPSTRPVIDGKKARDRQKPAPKESTDGSVS